MEEITFQLANKMTLNGTISKHKFMKLLKIFTIPNKIYLRKIFNKNKIIKTIAMTQKLLNLLKKLLIKE